MLYITKCNIFMKKSSKIVENILKIDIISVEVSLEG